MVAPGLPGWQGWTHTGGPGGRRSFGTAQPKPLRSRGELGKHAHTNLGSTGSRAEQTELEDEERTETGSGNGNPGDHLQNLRQVVSQHPRLDLTYFSPSIAGDSGPVSTDRKEPTTQTQPPRVTPNPQPMSGTSHKLS